jgi:hypothetical protein
MSENRVFVLDCHFAMSGRGSKYLLVLLLGAYQ